MTNPLPARPAGLRVARLGLSRRRFIQSCGILSFAGVATTAYGVGVEPESLLVTRYRLTPPHWPAGRRVHVYCASRGPENRPRGDFDHIDDSARPRPA